MLNFYLVGWWDLSTVADLRLLVNQIIVYCLNIPPAIFNGVILIHWSTADFGGLFLFFCSIQWSRFDKWSPIIRANSKSSVNLWFYSGVVHSHLLVLLTVYFAHLVELSKLIST
jgi:hypothetical protein